MNFITTDMLRMSPCSQQGSCVDCFEHYRSYEQQIYESLLYSRDIPRSEAAEITRTLASSAANNRKHLRETLSLHGDLFMSRWKKRSRDKRGELLANANANLPERRCVDLFEQTQFNKGFGDWKLSRTSQLRFRLLLPYLSSESLKENPGLLFALLHYRTKYTLDDWATFDMQLFHNAWESGLVDVNFSPGCVLAFGPRYGELVPFDEKLVHRGDIIGFPRAELLLEAQSELMNFLVRVVDATLEGASLDSPGNGKWSSACIEGFHASGAIVPWSSYSNAPFSAPPELDLDVCITTAQLRFNALADHLGLLQTDPAYARRHIRMVQQGKAFRTLGEDSLQWVDGYIAADVEILNWWLCIKEEAEHVKKLQLQFRDQIRRGYALPTKYETALAAFELVLVNFMNMRCKLIRGEVQQRPGFEKYWEYARLGPDKLTVRQTQPGIPVKFFSDPLFWCVMNLTESADKYLGFEHAHLFTFLDDHITRAPAEEQARLDQITLERLSDLAANHQMLLAVRLSRPQNKMGNKDALDKTENRRAWDSQLHKSGRIQSSSTRVRLLKRFCETQTPQGKQDKAWLDQFDQVRSNLAAYWTTMRATAKYQMQDETIAKCMKADLDPDHLADLASYRRRVSDNMAPKQIPAVPTDFLRELGLQDSTTKRPTKKEKKKTRPEQGKAATPQKPRDDPAVAPEDSARRPSTISTSSIKTTKRAMGVFSKMFCGESDVAGQGCDWDQFVLSMKDVGFSACSSTGSAVQFDLPDKGKIVFHKPHPVPKVDHIMLKAMGKRLKKWFGFGKETFTTAG